MVAAALMTSSTAITHRVVVGSPPSLEMTELESWKDAASGEPNSRALAPAHVSSWENV